MPSRTWSERGARVFAVLRGGMVGLFAVVLIVAPERTVAGSSTEPARSLALMFASRTILLGLALTVLALMRRREGLAWVLIADAALQLFDTGLALAMHKGALVAGPVVLGAIDVWAALALLRASRGSPVPGAD